MELTSLPKNPIKLLIHFLKPQKWRIFAYSPLCISLGLVPSIDSVFFKHIIDGVEKIKNPADTFSNLAFWIVFYILWWEFVNWTWRAYDYAYLKTLPKVKKNVLDGFYNYVQYHSGEFFRENMVGYISNRIMESAEALKEVIVLLTEKMLMKFSVITSSIITLYFVHPRIGIVFLFWIVFFASISSLTAKKASKLSGNYAKIRSTVTGRIVDAISNISSIRMYTNYKSERRFIAEYLDKNVQQEQKLHWFMLKVRYLQGIACSIFVGVVIYTLIGLRSKGLITIGDFVLVMTLLIVVAENVWDLMQEVGDLLEEFGSFSQITSLIKPYVISDKEDASTLKTHEATIAFQNVNFKYENDPELFSNKNLTIQGSQKVGLVGFSGSGKSTFVNLICRLVDVTSGSILIDGQDIRNVSLKSLRNEISLIPQHPILFQRSIRDNIKYGSEAVSDEMVIEAAKKAHIHNEIIQLENGYDTICSERGENLSGGQRQRIVIARAILKNSAILILDEATSALDNITEKYIKQSLDYLMKEKTVLVVAHRLSTLLDMDRILVFDKGKVVEDGTHKDLLKSKKLYYKLWNAQAGGFIADNEDDI